MAETHLLTKRTTTRLLYRPESGRRLYQRFLCFQAIDLSSVANTFFDHPFSLEVAYWHTRKSQVLRFTVMNRYVIVQYWSSLLSVISFVLGFGGVRGFRRVTICYLLIYYLLLSLLVTMMYRIDRISTYLLYKFNQH